MSALPILEVDGVSLSYRSRRSFFRHDEYPALRKVSFHVGRGETLGVIGGNGSGKSTLLRVLAGIYRPDAGRLRRRCESVMLLSLSLGFLSELTGRENALLSGVLLGARLREVRARLPEIVEFSGLGHHIDQPLKTYSNGMRARLGFSVALAMHADLLLIDEVMSVGDQEFRRKAEAALTDRLVSSQSVVLVSHSPKQITSLCDRALWLDQGRVRAIGPVDEISSAYASADSGRPVDAGRAQVPGRPDDG